MTTLRQAAEKAVECLENDSAQSNAINNALAFLRKALAEPQTTESQALRNIYEIWAGSEGIPVPETAVEAYLLRLIEQMRDEASKALAAPEQNCKTHPDAPHGFCRNASLSEDIYVCECEFWEPPQPEQDPVGQLQEETFGRGQVMWFKKPLDGAFLYTAPPQRQWVGLTDDEIEAALPSGIYDCLLDPYDCDVGDGDDTRSMKKDLLRCARAIEAKLKEKNHDRT